MAGNHIYLEPILDQATGGLNEIVAEINKSVNLQIGKLNDVVTTLTAILSSTGIELTQTGYTGSGLSGLGGYSSKYSNHIYGTIPTTNNSVELTSHGYSTALIDFTNIKKIKGTVTKTAGSASYWINAYLGIYANTQPLSDGTLIVSQTVANTPKDFEYDTTNITGFNTIYFYAYNGSNNRGNFTNLKIVTNDDEELDLFGETVNVISNTNGEIKTGTDNNSDYGFITLDISTITPNLWSTIIISSSSSNIPIMFFRKNYSKLDLSYPGGQNAIPLNELFGYSEFLRIKVYKDVIITGLTFRYS